MYHIEFCILYRAGEKCWWIVDGVNVENDDYSTVDEAIHIGREAMRLRHGTNDDFFAVGPVFCVVDKDE